jgi:hypothetical protein
MKTHPKFRPSKCKTFDVFAETLVLPILSEYVDELPKAYISVDRRCRQGIYIESEEPLGRVLLVPGFASNRGIFDMGGGVGILFSKCDSNISSYLSKAYFSNPR